jgi:hypothetical protein
MSREMRYKLSANVIVALHIIWTIILFGGAVFVIFEPWYAIFQMIAISLTLLIALPFGRVCPLTALEEWLRKKINPDYTNNGSYLATYINKAFGTNLKTKSVAVVIAILYVASYAISIFALAYK